MNTDFFGANQAARSGIGPYDLKKECRARSPNAPMNGTRMNADKHE
jgi:hypothetical protein